MTEPSTSTTVHSRTKKGRHIALLLVLVLTLLGSGSAWYYLTFMQHRQTTDDAYVAANLVPVTPQISGSVVAIDADDTDVVSEGTLLVTLDDTDARLAYENALHKLADTVRATRKLMAEAEQLKAVIATRHIAHAQARTNLTRREVLGTRNAVAIEELQHARDALLTTQQGVLEAQEQYNALAALLLNTPVDLQPQVLLAASLVRERWLALQRTRVTSPVLGQVAKRAVQVGSQATPGKPLMTIVPLAALWVDANFKEVQLANMRVGQPATIKADMYGNSVTYTGHVMGLGAGTGSVFSLLPPQNATGNWIKIVQRVPVRIALNPTKLATHPLLVGLSCTVNVDTSATDGPLLSATIERRSRDAQHQGLNTRALDVDFAPIDILISVIIRDNEGEARDTNTTIRPGTLNKTTPTKHNNSTTNVPSTSSPEHSHATPKR